MASREQIFHVLAEAAELEHNILCSYLYAVFSLKQREDEDLTGAELQAVGRWRATLLGLCVEEMMHLAQVCNLLVALGSRPHFNRPNLPTAPGYHPAGIAIGLSPLDMETLDHFIYLERPEDARASDGVPFATPGEPVAREVPKFVPLMPRGPNYSTIGEFYARLRDELESITSEMGEAALFVGTRGGQIDGGEIGSKELVVVANLADARRAIDIIVEQGEGSGGGREDSHYGKFSRIKEECEALTAARPGFRPYREAARNPVMHTPVNEGRVFINGAQAEPVLDAANAAYTLMLRCLSKVYEVPAAQAALRSSLLDGSIAAMKVLSELGCCLTELPARDGSDTRAGVSFAMLKSVEAPWRDGSVAVLGERFREIARRLPQLALPGVTGARLSKALADTAIASPPAAG